MQVNSTCRLKLDTGVGMRMKAPTAVSTAKKAVKINIRVRKGTLLRKLKKSKWFTKASIPEPLTNCKRKDIC